MHKNVEPLERIIVRIWELQKCEALMNEPTYLESYNAKQKYKKRLRGQNSQILRRR